MINCFWNALSYRCWHPCWFH